MKFINRGKYSIWRFFTSFYHLHKLLYTFVRHSCHFLEVAANRNDEGYVVYFECIKCYKRLFIHILFRRFSLLANLQNFRLHLQTITHRLWKNYYWKANKPYFCAAIILRELIVTIVPLGKKQIYNWMNYKFI